MEAAKEGEAGGLAKTLLGDGDVANMSWRREVELEEGLVLFCLMAAVAGRGGAKAIGANSRIRPEHEEWWRTPMAGCGWTWSSCPRSLQLPVAEPTPGSDLNTSGVGTTLRDVRDGKGNENRSGPGWKTILTTVFW